MINETLDSIQPKHWHAMSEKEKREFVSYWASQGKVSFLCLSCGFPTSCGQATCEACMPEPLGAAFPHCDDKVLHAPGSCKYCDKFHDAQSQRIADGIAFTGHDNPELSQDPAEAARPLDLIERWPGNRRKE